MFVREQDVHSIKFLGPWSKEKFQPILSFQTPLLFSFPMHFFFKFEFAECTVDSKINGTPKGVYFAPFEATFDCSCSEFTCI